MEKNNDTHPHVLAPGHAKMRRVPTAKSIYVFYEIYRSQEILITHIDLFIF